MAAFPNLPSAQPGCGGLEGCWQVDNSQWRSVAGNLEQQLAAAGYSVQQLNVEEDTGFRVYQISKNGKVQYLHLLSTLKGTVYLLKPEQLSQRELQQEAEAGVS